MVFETASEKNAEYLWSDCNLGLELAMIPIWCKPKRDKGVRMTDNWCELQWVASAG